MMFRLWNGSHTFDEDSLSSVEVRPEAADELAEKATMQRQNRMGSRFRQLDIRKRYRDF
jgi:hypothetical protein